MHIILLGRRNGAARQLSLDLRWLLLSVVLLVAVAATGGALLGAWLAPPSTALVQSVELDQALQAQADEVGDARRDAQRQLDAFAAHVAELQARLTRLDALGERLTELAELDASEFDFSLNVGQGGPEEPLEGGAYAPPPFMTTLNELTLRMDSREQQLEILEQLMAERRLDAATTLSGHPVLQGYVSSPFGRRVDPLTGRISMHKGVDFAAKAGSDVIAVGAGVVTFSGRRTGYGNTVEISHPDGYVTLYAHNKRNLAQVGDLVQRGQAIAEVGSTGRSTGNHVHFEVSHNGQVVNPHSYIARVSDSQ